MGDESPLREEEMKTFTLAAICVIIGLQGLGQGQAKARGPTSIAVRGENEESRFIIDGNVSAKCWFTGCDCCEDKCASQGNAGMCCVVKRWWFFKWTRWCKCEDFATTTTSTTSTTTTTTTTTPTTTTTTSTTTTATTTTAT